MTRIASSVLFVFTLASSIAACSDNGSTSADAATDAPVSGATDAGSAEAASVTDVPASEAGSKIGPSYFAEVLPILENKCMGCHQSGGIAPFSMQTYAETHLHAATISAYVSAGLMPPYYIKHDNTCGSFDDSAALTAGETQTLLAWANGASAEGTPGPVTVPPLPHLTGGTQYKTPLFSPVAQGTAVAEHDEYRCFMVDAGLTTDRYITGFEVMPGNATIVHHVIGFAVDPATVGDNGQPNSTIMQSLHAASPDREGWPCFGAAGDNVKVAGVPVEWAPGQGVVDYPSGMGFQMKSTYKLVVQVHYNLADPQSAGQQDSSTISVRYADTVNRRLAFFLPDAFLDTLRAGKPDTLPPGQTATTYTWQKTAAEVGIPSGLPYVDLVGVMPHMHGRGTGLELDTSAAGEALTCTAALTHWDFHWQKFYFYNPDRYPRLTPSGSIQVTCTYDTSAETAPVLPGWGTRNEMCLTVLMVALPPGA